MIAVIGMRAALERIAVAAVSWPLPSRLVGRLADLRLPRPLLVPLIRGYARAFGVDLSEAALAPDGYPSFNAFFTRRLLAGVRPIEAASGVVVSPSDSRLVSIGRVPEDGRLEQVKGQSYSIDALLGSTGDGGRLRWRPAGDALPEPVHVPPRSLSGGRPDRRLALRARPAVSGQRDGRALGAGSLHAQRAGRGPDRQRGSRTRGGGAGGRANVGRIQLAFADLATNARQAPGSFAPPSAIPIRRGDELGVFNLGSTVVLLVADARLEPALAPGVLTRVGRALWRRAPGAAALLLCAGALSGAPQPPLKVRPGTLVRWPGEGIEWCAAGGERFEPLAGACIVSVDLLHAAGPLELTRQRGGQLEKATVSVGRFDYPLQKLTLPRSMVELSPADLARVDRENRDMARLFKLRGPRRFSLPLGAPLDPLPVGGHFGQRRVINGEPRSPHGGADFAAPLGTPVPCAADGTVVMVANHFFGGNAVFVDHGDGLVSQYFHLSRDRRARRSAARAWRALVDAVGATGRATGPHLHFGTRWRGARVDPALLLAPPSALPCLDPRGA